MFLCIQGCRLYVFVLCMCPCYCDYILKVCEHNIYLRISPYEIYNLGAVRDKDELIGFWSWSWRDKVAKNYFGNFDDHAFQTSTLQTTMQGSYGQGKSEKVREFWGVRESQGKQRVSGKSHRILKYHSLDQLFMHYFHNFCRLLGALPQYPHRGSAPVNTAG